ncbi:MAG: tryptophan synthase subunit alpha [bacterium]
MNRLDLLKDKDSKHLVIYLMAGDPNLKTTENLIYSLAAQEVSAIELGIPFSDPVADGPTIQRAGERALANNIHIKDVLGLVARVRVRVNTPIVFMLYYNLIHSYGIKNFVNDCLKAGVDGVIVPDLPFDEEIEFYKYSKNKDFYVICLISPTNTVIRMKKIVEKTQGFVYYILLKGVTGAQKTLFSDFKFLSEIRKSSKLPVFAGFGISTPNQAAEVVKHADGVIVGSAYVELIEKYGKNTKKLLFKSEQFIKNILKKV